MSNFVPGNYNLRTALIFCYHLKKIAAECLSYGELLVNHSALSGLKNSKVAILRNEERGKLPKILKTANCKHCWMRMTLKLNNNSWINWMWHEKPSSYIWNPWERSRRWENGFHMNWMKDSRKTEKPFAKCCSPGTKESHFSIELWLAMKSGHILRILSVKDHG